MAEPITWITKNGKHIPIYADKPTEDEQRKKKQIEQNEQSALKKNRPDVTAEDIKKALLGDEPNYMDDPNYQEIQKMRSYWFNQREKAEDELHRIKEQLKTESKPKPKEEWDEDDEFHAMLGDRPKIYTDKGKELKQREDELWKVWSRADHAWTQLTDKEQDIDRANQKKQIAEYRKSTEFIGKVKKSRRQLFWF